MMFYVSLRESQSKKSITDTHKVKKRKSKYTITKNNSQRKIAGEEKRNYKTARKQLIARY